MIRSPERFQKIWKISRWDILCPATLILAVGLYKVVFDRYQIRQQLVQNTVFMFFLKYNYYY